MVAVAGTLGLPSGAALLWSDGTQTQVSAAGETALANGICVQLR